MSGPYDVLMVDPPWPVAEVFSRPLHRAGRRPITTPYAVLTWAEVWVGLDADVLSQAAPHCALFLWALEQYLTETERELTARGFVRVHRLIWDKERGLYIGTGAVRRQHEYLLWYCRPRLLPIAREAAGKWPSVLRERSRQHSRKPESAYQMVEALYPTARKLDAFTREYRVGWSAFGWEQDKFTPLLAPLREAQA